jgi:hypothetical protein
MPVEQIAGQYQATPQTFGDGGTIAVQVDASGNLKVVGAGFIPVGITTKTTTLVKTGAGVIGDITINATGSADTITVYDALTATGTPLATITAPTVGMKFCELYQFTVGLCIVTGGTTAGNYTVSYQ